MRSLGGTSSDMERSPEDVWSVSRLARRDNARAARYTILIPPRRVHSPTTRRTVALYFKYRSADDLQADCQRLGLTVRLSGDFSPLFRPINVGPLTAGNALCIQP